jgi:hypothetical protein
MRYLGHPPGRDVWEVSRCVVMNRHTQSQAFLLPSADLFAMFVFGRRAKLCVRLASMLCGFTSLGLRARVYPWSGQFAELHMRCSGPCHCSVQWIWPGPGYEYVTNGNITKSRFENMDVVFDSLLIFAEASRASY